MKLTLWEQGKHRQEIWSRWFAWHPVFADSADDCPNGHMTLKFIWFENVERKEYLAYSGWHWRYREIV